MRKPKTQPNELDLFYKRVRSVAFGAVVRSKKWKDYIKELPCTGCGIMGRSEPHYIFTSTGNLKSSDIFTVPLERSCHEDYEANPKENARLVEQWIGIAHEFIKINLGGRKSVH